MTISTAALEALRDAAQELVDAAEDVLMIRYAPREDYEPEDRQAAQDELDSARRVVAAIVGPPPDP